MALFLPKLPICLLTGGFNPFITFDIITNGEGLTIAILFSARFVAFLYLSPPLPPLCFIDFFLELHDLISFSFLFV